jgi:threonine dehydrogenase-like Zn-dependent dehydrogenase
MKAISFPAKDRIILCDGPDPAPGPGEVLVEVRASGICHTDLEILRGNYGTSAFPVVPGHEFAGVVLETGSGVTTVSVGDRVVIDPNIECRHCSACKRGWAHLCENLGAYGVTVNGGFADICAVKASAVHPIGDLSFHVAALAEPVGCVLNGLEAVNTENAQTALVFGAGPIGLLMAVALKVRGISQIMLVDLDENRLELARSFGFEPVLAESAELKALNRSVDLVVDATGVPAVAGGLINYIANGGTGLFIGVCPQDARIEISPFELFRRQITLAGSHSLNHNIPEALRTIHAFGPGIERAISHRLPLEDVAQILSNGAPGGALKIQAVWER